jgi:AcrR family transcriptional regulator
MVKTTRKRRTQGERREASRQAVLDSAYRLFGEKGYADCSLDEIAGDCGMTIRPIYHYFGNKKALFAAVNAAAETRIIASMASGLNLRGFLDLCEDPGFRRIVLVDGPNILGRARWVDSPVWTRAMELLRGASAGRHDSDLLTRMIMGAWTEAALWLAEQDNDPAARRKVDKVMKELTEKLLG